MGSEDWVGGSAGLLPPVGVLLSKASAESGSTCD